MKLFGLEITRAGREKAAGTGWWRVLESFTGAWQTNVEVSVEGASANWAVFGCATLIAGDIAKMPAVVMQYDQGQRIWRATQQRPVLRKPNHYQTRVDFFKSWVFSLLFKGNTYVLKARGPDGRIAALHVLDPHRVMPLVSPSGEVFYQLGQDDLAGSKSVTVPASEVIHDRMYTLWHPLCGVSPIYACGVAAAQGSAIQQNSAKFFQNMSRPSGILTAPGAISNETANRLKEYWNTNFTGENMGKIAVVGDDLKYVPLTISAEDSQLIEQLKFTGEMICATFHVPPYKLGLGQMPTVNNTSALNQQYYDQALQPIAEGIELRLDEGLELPDFHEVWLDTKALVRMDPEARYRSHNEAIKGGWLKPNEARREEDLPPVEGGDTPYMQQQNYSLAALAKRDEREMEEPSEQDISGESEEDLEASMRMWKAMASEVAKCSVPVS